jgi:hypothetical protein
MDISQIVSDALTWEAIKYTGSRAAGALLMTGVGQYLLQKVFGKLKKPQERTAFWLGMPVLLFVFLWFLGPNNQVAAPELKGQIEAVHFNEAPDNPANLLTIMNITNSGAMPSFAAGWKIEVLHGKQTIDCPVMTMPEKLIIKFAARGSIPERTVTYYGKDSLAVKAISSVGSGALVSGLLLCQPSNSEVKSLRPEDKVKITFSDVLGHAHEAEILIVPQLGDLKSYSGIGELSG